MSTYTRGTEQAIRTETFVFPPDGTQPVKLTEFPELLCYLGVQGRTVFHAYRLDDGAPHNLLGRLTVINPQDMDLINALSEHFGVLVTFLLEPELDRLGDVTRNYELVPRSIATYVPAQYLS